MRHHSAFEWSSTHGTSGTRTSVPSATALSARIYDDLEDICKAVGAIHEEIDDGLNDANRRLVARRLKQLRERLENVRDSLR
jgi:hypothetical protein